MRCELLEAGEAGLGAVEEVSLLLEDLLQEALAGGGEVLPARRSRPHLAYADLSALGPRPQVCRLALPRLHFAKVLPLSRREAVSVGQKHREEQARPLAEPRLRLTSRR